MKITHAATLLLASAFLLGSANAQDYPSRPVKVIVPYSPGSTLDAVVRFVSQQFQAKTGQPAVVEYKPGAGAIIGAQAVLAEPRDGHTLYTPGASVATWKIFNKEATVDLRRDFTPVTPFYTVGYMVVTNASVPAKTLQEFIAYAKANPRKLNYGQSNGAFMLSMELLMRMTGMELVQVPYKAGADAKRGLLGNEVQVILDNDAFHVQMMKEGKERILAVTSPQRIPNIPDIPTVQEAGVRDYLAGSWTGVFVAAGTPAPVVNRIYGVVRGAIESEEYRALLGKIGFGNQPGGTPPADWAKQIDAETRAYEDVATRLGLLK